MWREVKGGRVKGRGRLKKRGKKEKKGIQEEISSAALLGSARRHGNSSEARRTADKRIRSFLVSASLYVSHPEISGQLIRSLPESLFLLLLMKTRLMAKRPLATSHMDTYSSVWGVFHSSTFSGLLNLFFALAKYILILHSNIFTGASRSSASQQCTSPSLLLHYSQ